MAYKFLNYKSYKGREINTPLTTIALKSMSYR